MACTWYAKNGKKYLKDRKISSSSIMLSNKRTYIGRIPLGVVGVVSPWNYPFSIPFAEIIMGLMAGNAILYKVSEDTPLVGLEIEKALYAGELPDGLTKMVMGDGASIAASWFENKIDKIFFTGSTRVGKILMKQAAETLTPLSLELGGNDAAIVFEDANLKRAANGIVWAGFQNCGQTCAGVERVYVQESVADKFIQLLIDRVDLLRQGPEENKFNVDIGAVTVKRQLETIERHVDDALKKGAVIAAQTKMDNVSEGNFYPVTVLTNLDHTMSVMREETFGPVIGVMTFKTEEEAIRLANDSDLGLTSSIWTMDTKKAKKLSACLETGTTTINDHVYTQGLSEIPWTGWKNSGIGVTHSSIGLEEMTKVKVINYDLIPQLNKNLWWFPANLFKFNLVLHMLPVLYSNSIFKRFWGMFRLLRTLTRNH
jgi:acyl-CoA reductase-like NAD-dependent aldehyde dehydrogenase